MGTDRTIVARRATGIADGRLVEWASQPLVNAWGMPTTRSIERVRGVIDAAGTRHAFSAIAKTLQSVRHFPLLAAMPAEARAAAEAAMPWRIELEVYASGLHDALPPGLRAPRLYAVEELGDDQATLWLEDVEGATGPWDEPTYADAARVLGRLAGRFPEAAIPFTFTRMNVDLRLLLDVRIANGTMPLLRDDATWAHPLVRDAIDPGMRSDTLRLWERAHGLLQLLAGLPRTLVHGDACPQNLFVHREPGRTRFTAIDWGLTGTGPLAADLVQLIAGRVESGDLDAAQVEPIEEMILPAYAAGLAEEGHAVDPERLATAYRAQLVLRCGITALPVERLRADPSPRDDPSLPELFRKRARWGRHLLNVADILTATAAPR